MYKGFPSREEYQKWLGSEISRIHAEIEASHPGIFDDEEYCRPTKRAVDPPSALPSVDVLPEGKVVVIFCPAKSAGN